MRIQTQSAMFLSAITILLATAGCRPSGGNGGTTDATLIVVNTGQRAVRIGIARSTAFNTPSTSTQPADTITDLTPLLQPGEATTLPFPALSYTEEFNAFVTGLDTESELLGPFPCRIDRLCLDTEPARIIWTGSTILCANFDQAVVELVNNSTATAYLLLGDEQPALPVLPFAPGERRFTQLQRTAGLPSNVQIRALTINPILGPLEVTRIQCALLQSCQTRRVRFDGQTLECGEFQLDEP